MNNLRLDIKHFVFFIGLALFFAGSFIWAQKSKVNPFSKKVSILIQFDGDYKGQYQFDGEMKKEISGEPTNAPNFPVNNQCQFKGFFDIVRYKNQNMLKVNLTSSCSLAANQKTSQVISKLFPEFVRLSDLKSESQQIQISKEFKNVQFKVIDLKL